MCQVEDAKWVKKQQKQVAKVGIKSGEKGSKINKYKSFQYQNLIIA